MREIKYLSPTSLAKWIENQESFYLDYLADARPPRGKQTQPMSIGSAFDAYAKSFLHGRLFGKSHKDAAQFELKTLFEAQVEPHNRDWAWVHGERVFKWYAESGVLLDMMKEMEGAIGEPRFEMSIEGFVNHDVHSIPFLGKPDIFMINSKGVKVTLDWKVNGYCSGQGVSPKPGYVRLYPGFDQHKDAYPVEYKGVLVNGGRNLATGQPNTLNDIDESWNRQTIIYSWLCGCAVGEEFILGIDQIVARGKDKFGLPALRCAKHRYRSNVEQQVNTYRLAAECWKSVTNGPENYFIGLSPEESKDRCNILEERARQMYAGSGDADFDDVCRVNTPYGY